MVWYIDFESLNFEIILALGKFSWQPDSMSMRCWPVIIEYYYGMSQEPRSWTQILKDLFPSCYWHHRSREIMEVVPWKFNFLPGPAFWGGAAPAYRALCLCVFLRQSLILTSSPANFLTQLQLRVNERNEETWVTQVLLPATFMRSWPTISTELAPSTTES